LVIDPAPFCPRISLALASITQTRRERNPNTRAIPQARTREREREQAVPLMRSCIHFFIGYPASEQPRKQTRKQKKIARRIGEQLF
jgi:hypothetical protein